MKSKEFQQENLKWKFVDFSIVKFLVFSGIRRRSNGWLSRSVEKAIAAVAGRQNEVDRADSAATNQTGK